MSGMIIAVIVIAALLVIGIGWYIACYNGLIRLKTMVTEAWSGVDVQLKRRYDLIPNLVAVVQGYATHEKGIFDEIARMRAYSMGAKSIEEKSAAENALTQSLKTVFALAENYPNLKAHENFLSLSRDLSIVEHEIQLARRYYNGAARNYNVAIAQFPALYVARSMRYEPAAYFEASVEHERNAPKIKF